MEEGECHTAHYPDYSCHKDHLADELQDEKTRYFSSTMPIGEPESVPSPEEGLVIKVQLSATQAC